eukprot:TRINITY_DN2850_c0_g1_i2.p3 TRINITY_DN2850_c0_g1~~TRINITY_DN2850_c0_g1_i2.p3  ORF type:complete len:130 (+),score=4.98 TRINITY_DN2850_c0_g1_i2:520-909(+)
MEFSIFPIIFCIGSLQFQFQKQKQKRNSSNKSSDMVLKVNQDTVKQFKMKTNLSEVPKLFKDASFNKYTLRFFVGCAIQNIQDYNDRTKVCDSFVMQLSMQFFKKYIWLNIIVGQGDMRVWVNCMPFES